MLRGGLEVAHEAGCHVGGGHSIDDPEPKYGMAVTGIVDVDRMIPTTARSPATPLSLTKPLGVGVLNSRLKATGEVSEEAVASMTALNREAGQAAVAAGIRAGTDVTGFGLLGHLYKMARASGVTAVVDAAAVPYLTGAREALADGFVSGGTRRNLDWVRPHTDLSAVSRGRGAAAGRRADLRRAAAGRRGAGRAGDRRVRARAGSTSSSSADGAAARRPPAHAEPAASRRPVPEPGPIARAGCPRRGGLRPRRRGPRARGWPGRARCCRSAQRGVVGGDHVHLGVLLQDLDLPVQPGAEQPPGMPRVGVTTRTFSQPRPGRRW